MNNKIRLIFSLTLILILSCSVTEIDGNYLGVSRSSKDSEKANLLIERYLPANKIIHLDSLGQRIRIKEIFVEQKWRSVSGGNIKKTRGYQIVIVFKDRLPSDYSSKWMLGLSKNILFNTLDKKLLVSDIQTDMLQNEMIEVTIYEGDVVHFKSNPNGVTKKKNQFQMNK